MTPSAPRLVEAMRRLYALDELMRALTRTELDGRTQARS
jgi:hypothetical protein